MTAPPIHGNRRTLSAFALVEAIGRDLSEIRHQDGLTWADVGRILGKSEDQAAKYADGSAEMPVTTFLFGLREWGARLSGRAEALISAARGPSDPRQALPALLACASGLAAALADGSISDGEIRANRRALEDAAGQISALLARVGEG